MLRASHQTFCKVLAFRFLGAINSTANNQFVYCRFDGRHRFHRSVFYSSPCLCLPAVGSVHLPYSPRLRIGSVWLESVWCGHSCISVEIPVIMACQAPNSSELQASGEVQASLVCSDHLSCLLSRRTSYIMGTPCIMGRIACHGAHHGMMHFGCLSCLEQGRA